MAIIPASYSPGFVAASIVIAVWASYVALETAPRIRAHRGRVRAAWVAVTSFCLGAGIWSMHFLAMLAYEVPIEVSYDVWITLLSLALPVVTAAVGFAYVQRDQEFRRGTAVAVGGLFGVAIVLMHYTGMEAMRMDAAMTYDPKLVLLSFLIAVAASISAIRLSFHHTRPLRRAVGAVLMGSAISGMHYCGMAAATLRNGHGHLGEGMGIDRTALGLAIALLIAVFLSAGWIAAVYDRSKGPAGR